jgi:hypothetical protein
MERLDSSTSWNGVIKSLDQRGSNSRDQACTRTKAGDPLSPLLFILTIDLLQRIIDATAQGGMLKLILPKAANLRCSLYADDAAIFTYPENTELDNLLKMLNFFGESSGLKINISKMEIFPIRMDSTAISQLLQNFPGKICSFLGKYLGLPLHVQKLHKVEIQPLIDKIGARLPGWKGRFLSTARRETLVKTVLYLISTNLPHDRVSRT